MEIEDDFIKRLKEEEALLRVKAESLGIMIDLAEEERHPEEEIKGEHPHPREEPADEGASSRIEEGADQIEEEKDRFTLFLGDVKRQRHTLEGEEEEGADGDLLAETEDVLGLYTREYLARNIGEAKAQYARLQETPVPPGTNMVTEKKIKKNLADLLSRIDEAEEFMEAVPAKKIPPLLERRRPLAPEGTPHEKPKSVSSKRTLYEEFLGKTELFIQEWPASRLAENLAECEDAFGKLLEEGKALPSEEEEDLERKILANLEVVQNEISEAKKIKHEERGRLILRAIRKLKDSKGYNPSAYNNVAMKFQNLAPDLPDEMRDIIKEELSECYSMMKEFEAKRKEEEKKAQAEGIRVYWGTYLKKVDTFVSEIEKARPVEIMDYYVRYKKLVAEYERMNKQEISDFEVDAAQEKLDECYDLLERLRLQT